MSATCWCVYPSDSRLTTRSDTFIGDDVVDVPGYDVAVFVF